MQPQALILETGISRAAHAPGASRGVPTPNEPGCASPHRDEGHVRRLNEMRHPIETEFVQIENVVCNSSPWEARTTLAPNALGTQTLHARSVELVAQPGKNSRVGKLCPWRLDGPPQEATRIRGRDRSQFCERAAAYSRDEFLEVREGCRQSLGILGSCFEDGLTVNRCLHKSSYVSGGDARFC